MRLAVHAKRSTLYGRSNGRKCKFFPFNGLQLFRMIMRLCCARCAPCELRYCPLSTSYCPKAISPRCEASFDFIKIALLFFSHNSHSVGNELSLTLKLISSLEKSWFSLLCKKKYCLPYIHFILSSKSYIAIGMEQENNVERFETSRLNSTEICSMNLQVKLHMSWYTCMAVRT